MQEEEAEDRKEILEEISSKLPLDYLRRYARAYHDAKSFRFALIFYDEIVRRGLADGSDFYWRGGALSWLEDQPSAIENYNLGMEVSSKSEVTYLQCLTARGDSYTRIGTDEGFALAIRDYTSALDLDASSTDILFHRASAYLKLRMFEDSLIDYSKALERDPALCTALTGRALIYVIRGRRDLAMADFEAAFSIPDGLVNRFSVGTRGLARLVWGEYDDALQDLSTCLDIESSRCDLQSQSIHLWRRALVLRHIPDGISVAIADIERSHRLCPGFPRLVETIELFPSLEEEVEEFLAQVGSSDAMWEMWKKLPDAMSLLERCDFFGHLLVEGRFQGVVRCHLPTVLLQATRSIVEPGAAFL